MSVQLNIGVISLLLLFTSTAKAQSDVFDVVAEYGAKADEETDLRQPLLDAWKEACESTTPSKIVIPEGTYLLSQAALEGPCKAPIELQVQGTVKAPVDPSAFKEPNWVVFNRLDQFTVSGGGVFDGQGATTWGKNDCVKNKYCATLPINLRFNFVSNAMIQDITTKDSKQFHVNVLGCKNISFLRFSVSAPEDSLNTDGIHIGRSDGVNITNTIIKTGDDCLPSRIKLRNISFKNIRGTSSTQQAVKLICSSGLPCEGVELADIDITYSGPEGPATSQCTNVSPKLSGKQNPSACSSPA
ncbi:Glycoside hydrolase [Theobroma cacao]|nr:Glycoside hydrolase [Theobroma cacao]